MIKLLKLRTYERLLLIGFVCFLMLSILISARSVKILPQILDLDCYQEKCGTEKDLWDDTNSMCIFTPKIFYYEEYFEKNGGGKAVELESFLSKKLGSDEKAVLYVFTRSPSPIHSRQLSIEQKRALLEFQCSQAGLIFGSKSCDESFTDNFLFLLDKDFLKSDLSLDNKYKITDLYSSCLVFAYPEELEQQRKERKNITILFLLFLFMSGGIILSSWIRHVKEEKAHKYITQGLLGFLIATLHNLFSFYFSFSVVHNILGSWILQEISTFTEMYYLACGVLILLLAGGCILELKFYKKTKKLFWAYALIFSLFIIIYIALLEIMYGILLDLTFIIK